MVNLGRTGPLSNTEKHYKRLFKRYGYTFDKNWSASSSFRSNGYTVWRHEKYDIAIAFQAYRGYGVIAKLSDQRFDENPIPLALSAGQEFHYSELRSLFPILAIWGEKQGECARSQRIEGITKMRPRRKKKLSLGQYQELGEKMLAVLNEVSAMVDTVSSVKGAITPVADLLNAITCLNRARSELEAELWRDLSVESDDASRFFKIFYPSAKECD